LIPSPRFIKREIWKIPLCTRMCLLFTYILYNIVFTQKVKNSNALVQVLWPFQPGQGTHLTQWCDFAEVSRAWYLIQNFSVSKRIILYERILRIVCYCSNECLILKYIVPKRVPDFKWEILKRIQTSCT